MFRGFAVEEGADFEGIVQQYEPELSNEYRGTSPRKLIPGTQVQSSPQTPFTCTRVRVCSAQCI